ncbi:MAG: hypothetical protein NVSMB29_02330 [Candidatus Dormibacteria bacterium]
MILASLLAHAFGQRYSLPVPLGLFVVGGAGIVFVSFLVVLPRPAGSGRTTTEIVEEPRPHGVAAGQALGLAILLLMVIAGFAGSNAVAENILPTLFWLLIWIMVPITCALAGDWTRRLNPFALLTRLGDRRAVRRALIGDEEPLAWPGWLGWWPGVLFFGVGVLGELVFNSVATLPSSIALGLAVYGLISVGGGVFFGTSAWLGHAELFSVLFRTWGRLGWFRFGRPGPRGFGGGLHHGFEPSVSRVTFVLLLLVSVSYDGLLATPAWKAARLALPGGILPGTSAYLALTTAGLFALALIAWALLVGIATIVRRAGGLAGGRIVVAADLLPSLVPIAFGYLIAHNIEYIAINGQLLIPLLGDPLGRGWHLLAAPFTDAYRINVNLLPSSIAWYLEVAVIVIVHIAALVIAHRYLGRAATSTARARRSEWPWMAAMVGYTMTSLWLLAQPLVDEGSSGAAHRMTPAGAAAMVAGGDRQ